MLRHTPRIRVCIHLNVAQPLYTHRHQGRSDGLQAAHLAALGAAQVLQLEGARLQAHCTQQLRLDRRQVVCIAAGLAAPLVRLRTPQLSLIPVLFRPHLFSQCCQLMLLHFEVQCGVRLHLLQI